MRTARFVSWGADSRAGFVDQQLASGSVSEREARAYAEREFVALLPAGLKSPGHHIWCAYDGELEVGTLWMGINHRSGNLDAFVYDFSVTPHARRRGYGRAIMAAGEARVRSHGALSVRLNVFGHNLAAHRLYEGLGYTATVTNMSRSLDADHPPARSDALRLRLEPMTQAAFDAYRAVAPRDTSIVLPHGVATPDHFLWTVYDRELEVGVIWLQISPKADGLHAFGHDLSVREDLRGRGYEHALAAAADRFCRGRGVISLGLNVLGPDPAAWPPYQQAGFRVTATLMHKHL